MGFDEDLRYQELTGEIPGKAAVAEPAVIEPPPMLDIGVSEGHRGFHHERDVTEAAHVSWAKARRAPGSFSGEQTAADQKGDDDEPAAQDTAADPVAGIVLTHTNMQITWLAAKIEAYREISALAGGELDAFAGGSFVAEKLRNEIAQREIQALSTLLPMMCDEIVSQKFSLRAYRIVGFTPLAIHLKVIGS